MKQKEVDILVVGAGLTGLLTTYCLSLRGFKIAMIDKNDFIDPRNIKYDFRTTAIAEGSKDFLSEISLWDKISKYAEPIKKIKVFDRKQSNRIKFENPQNKLPLGYIVENKHIKKIIIEKIKNNKSIILVRDSLLKEVESTDNFILSKTNNIIIKSKLLIAADGKNSFVRNIIKTPIYNKSYKQYALGINLDHLKNHQNIAYELFYKTGPIGILPMKSRSTNFFSSSIVWSNNLDYLKSLTAFENTKMKFFLQDKLEEYLGEIVKIKNYKIFNLSAHVNSFFYEKRLVYVGDAAHSMHPIAGQGWNVGVRDIKNLMQSINDGVSLGLDPGDGYICKNYHNKSFYDAFLMFQITDKLNSIFLKEGFIGNNIRKIGFEIIENHKKLNGLIANFAMGKRKNFLNFN